MTVLMQWMERAACRGVDPDIFFPPIEGPACVRTARMVCAGCPVYDECLSWVLDSYEDIPHGIFAGFPAAERSAFDGMTRQVYDWRKTNWTSVRIKPTKTKVERMSEEHRKEVAHWRAERETERERFRLEKAKARAAEALRLSKIERQHRAWLDDLRKEEAERKERLRQIVAARRNAETNRPSCPTHGSMSMFATPQSQQQKDRNRLTWRCYVCRRKVVRKDVRAS